MTWQWTVILASFIWVLGLLVALNMILEKGERK